MKKILFVLFTLLSIKVSAQSVNIPDPIFKAYLLNHQGINTNADTAITIAEASAYSDTIDVTSLGISDLTGIEAFVNLTYLICSNNFLQSLNVSYNSALIGLACLQNQLQSIDISNNTSLIEFGCTDNQIQSLDVSNNTSLIYLFCDYNLLQNLDVSNNTNLIWLYCHHNQLQSFDVSNNIYLEDLTIWGNQLTCLNLKNGTNINTNLHLSAHDNPNLTCIEVDDSLWATTRWTVANLSVDAGMSFSENCNNVCSSNPIPCSALFSLHRDTTTAYHWYALNQTAGASPINYTWFWGDGDSSTGAYPSHTYDTAGYYNICVTIADGTGCTDTYCDSSTYIYKNGRAAIGIDVVAQLPFVTGVEKSYNIHFSIYPNPTNNLLNITTTLQGNEGIQYQIINTLGATAMANKATAKDFSIDVSTLPAGIYFIHLQSGNAQTVKRFVKE